MRQVCWSRRRGWNRRRLPRHALLDPIDRHEPRADSHRADSQHERLPPDGFRQLAFVFNGDGFDYLRAQPTRHKSSPDQAAGLTSSEDFDSPAPRYGPRYCNTARDR